MKTTVLCLTVLGCALAVPNGYYHQEYNYKSSSSAYKNNELQHQTDDEGYYKKDGDLEGKVRPRIDANSEHSEYINPNLRNSQYGSGYAAGSNADMSSYGHMRAESGFGAGSYGSHGLATEGLAQSDHITGRKGHSSGSYGSNAFGTNAYGSNAYGSNVYGSSSQSYGMSSNLRSVTNRLQQQLERELQDAIHSNNAYSQSSRLDVSELERELKRNLTERLNNELMNRYGQQSIRGGLSYSMSGGRVQSTANYDNQELVDLRRQLESSLLDQLRTQYNQRYSGTYISQGNLGWSTTTLRPVQVYWNQPGQTTPRSSYWQQYGTTTTLRPSYWTEAGPTYTTRPLYPDLTHLRHDSITNIASKVQNQLDSNLNNVLDDVQKRYFSSSSNYYLTNTDVVLERLRNELKRNLTELLDEDIRRNYGSQLQRNGNMYTVGSTGATSSQSNYAVNDLENLKTQIERNLIEKLNRDFETYRTRWSQAYSGSRYQQSSTSRYDSTYGSSQHGYGTSYKGYGSSQQEYGSSSNMADLQRKLQQDLSRQLQEALRRGQYSLYTSAGTYNPQTYQDSLQKLSDQLNRNLTRQLQEYSSSSSWSTYGNVDDAQMKSMRNQLQADLMKQLTDKLQQSYQTSSSYSSSSSSSSSSNYRPVRGFPNYQSGQYRSGSSMATMEGQDCLGDDPGAYRIKRSVYQPYRSQPLGIGYNSGYNRGYNTDYSGNYGVPGNSYGDSSYSRSRPEQVQQLGQQQIEVGQEEDDYDLTQQVVQPGFGTLHTGEQGSQQLIEPGQQQIEVGQQVDESDLTQQVEDSGFGKLQLGSQQSQQQIQDHSDLTHTSYGKLQIGSHRHPQHVEFGQQEDNSDLTQQVEDSGFGTLQIASHQHPQYVGQQEDNSDLTQQVEDSGFGKLQIGSQRHPQQQTELGQHEDNYDLTQQVEDSGYGKLQLSSQQQQQQQEQNELGQEQENYDLTQQVEDTGYGKLQTSSQQQQQQQQIEFGQNNDDLTQQPEDSGFGKLQIGSQHPQQQLEFGQQEDNSDLTQQVEDSGFGKLQFGSQSQHPIYVDNNRPLTQQQIENEKVEDSRLIGQVEDNISGKLQLGNQEQIRQEADLTQQVEDDGFGKLQFGGQQQIGQEPEDLHLTPQEQIRQKDDLTQQVENDGFGKLQLGGQQQIGQEPEDLHLTQQEQIRQEPDLTQQVEDDGFGKLQFGGQQQIGQEPEDLHLTPQEQIRQKDDLTQQVENDGFGKLQLGGQQQIGQEPEDLHLTQQEQITQEPDLTQQVEDDGFGKLQFEGQQQIGQEPEDLHLTHQEIFRHPPERIQFEKQLNQQNEDDLKLTQQQVDLTQVDNSYYTPSHSSSANLHLGSQQNEDDSKLSQQVDLTQEADNTYYIPSQVPLANLHLGHQQNEDNFQLTQQQVDQVDVDNTYHRRSQTPSTSLQFGNQVSQQNELTQQQLDLDEKINNFYPKRRRPFSGHANRKPIDSNSFLQGEIEQQEKDLYYQNPHVSEQQQININQQSNVQEQIDTNSKVEPLRPLHPANDNEDYSSTDLPDKKLSREEDEHVTQQVDSDQEENFLIDQSNVEPGQSQINKNQQHSGSSPTTLGNTFRVTDQGHLITQQQSLAEAENEADLLIQKLKTAQENRATQQQSAQAESQHNQGSFEQSYHNRPHITYAQVVSGGSYRRQNYESPISSQTIHSATNNQHQQNNYGDNLNRQQIQFAQKLEDKLSKQLQGTIEQYRTTDLDFENGQSHEQVRHQLEKLEKNIPKRLQIFFELMDNAEPDNFGYDSAYKSLTNQQREKLLKQIQTDLSQQCQQSIQEYDNLQQNSRQNFNEGLSPPSSTSYGSRYRHSYSSYGRSSVNYVQGNSLNSQVHYGQPKQVVENIETTSDIEPLEPQQANVIESVEPLQTHTELKGHSPLPPSAVLPSLPPEEFPVSENAPIAETANQDELPPEQLPWWKRFGQKIKHGAQNLKEKIVGKSE